VALLKLKDFDPNYFETFGGNDLKRLDVYTKGKNDKIGTISDVLVDQDGHFRYLVVDIGFWILGKRVLLPIGHARHDHNARRVFVSLTKEQARALPKYNENMAVDYNQEEQVRAVYRSTASTSGATPAQASNATYDSNTYTYQQDLSLYEMNNRDHQTLKLYEERLLANKKRVQTGEVAECN
jgi:DNA-binding MarR family transcriptional regulator